MFFLFFSQPDGANLPSKIGFEWLSLYFNLKYCIN